jgi:zinc protease
LLGDFDPAVAKPLIEKYFGPIPRGPEVPVPDVPQPLLKSEIRDKVVDAVAEVPKVSIVWNGGKPYTEDEPAGDVLSFILGAGKSSRLYKALVFDKQVASSVSAANVTLRLGGWFSIDATARSGHTVQEILPLLQAIVADVKRGVTPAEVERAKRKILAHRLRDLERIGGFGGKADQLNEYEQHTGDPGYLPRDLARYRAVTPEAVQAFANKYLPDDRRLILEVEPATRRAAALTR